MKLSDLNPFRRKPPAEPQEKTWHMTQEGALHSSWDLGWWQQDLKPGQNPMNETVEACISALSQTVSMCPAHHLEDLDTGEARRLKGSFVERALLNPNEQMTRSVFFNNLIRSLYFEGNGYAAATRDGNRAINGMTLLNPRNVNPVQDPETGDVFYWASTNNFGQFNPETDLVYPARDMLHVRINVDPQYPLKGVSPITAAAYSIAASSAITKHQARFFENWARPSGILSTPESLNREQMVQLREAVERKSTGRGMGGVPILGNGLKWESMSLTSQDAQLVEAFGMTVQSISRVFRVPLQMINDMTNSTFANAEQAYNWFLASGLGFLLEHIELELIKLFGLPFNQRINFNTKALLRSDWQSQINALGEGVLKGVYSPNEARNMVGLPNVTDGDEPRVQQQVVPLSAWNETLSTPAPAPEPEPTPEPEPEKVIDITEILTRGAKSHG